MTTSDIWLDAARAGHRAYEERLSRSGRFMKRLLWDELSPEHQAAWVDAVQAAAGEIEQRLDHAHLPVPANDR